MGQSTTATIGSCDFTPNPSLSGSNLLSKIIYPTKGYSEFEYESGKYISGNSVNYGGGPRIISISDYSENELAKKRLFLYSNGMIQNDPVTDISLYLTPKMIFKASPLCPPNGYNYATKQRIISNQVHWGANIDVYYPEVEIVYQVGNKNFKEKYYYNSEPENIFYTIFQLDYPYFMASKFNNNPLKGKLTRKEKYNASDSLVQSEDYFYHVSERASIDNLAAFNQVGTPLTFQRREIIRSAIGGSSLIPNPMFVYTYYQISVPNAYLKSKTIINYFHSGNIGQTETFSYLPGSDVRVENHSIIASDSQEAKINYTYIDASINNEMFLKNMISMVRNTKYTKNNGSILTQNDYNSSGLLTKVSSARGVGLLPPIESNIDYTYDEKGNISSSSKTGEIPVIYVWGYNYTYPVAKIEGLAYSQFSQTINASLLSAIGNCNVNSMMSTYLNTLRTSLQGFYVTTYIHDNIMGTLTSLTDPRGVTTYYDYDGLGRLNRTYIIENDTEKNIQTYDYHYKQ